MHAFVNNKFQFCEKQAVGDVLQKSQDHRASAKEYAGVHTLTTAMFVVISVVFGSVLAGCLPLPRAPVEGTGALPRLSRRLR